MRRLAISLLFFVALFFAFAYSVYFSIEQISRASDNVKGASIAAIVTVFTFLVGRYLEQKREIKQRVNSEKIRVYTKFFDMFFGLLSDTQKKRKDSKSHTEELTKGIRDFQKELFLWGSDQVIHSWSSFMNIAQDSEDGRTKERDLVALLRASTNLLISMRKDVGYPFTSISEKDLAALILSAGSEEKEILERL